MEKSLCASIGRLSLTENVLAEVQSFDMEDNGIGFTDENCLSFDTLFSDFKINEGGKGDL